MNRLSRVASIGVSVFLAVSSLTAQTPAPLSSKPAATKIESCSQTAKTQTGLSECAGRELQQAEARLSALLKRLNIDANSPEEKAWEAYRDAQLKAIYPPVSDERAEYGSVYPMCWATLKQKLTESRIRDLKALTTAEGDACHGYRAGNGK
ncbi:MAG: DUF1311 domain-containing protein [Acidobacteria bacterium]|nr:DUF1311 domain-containing protein [Acidobacteriota bacterium]